MACVRIALTRHAPLLWHVVKPVVAPRATKWRFKKATKIQFQPEIIAVRDGLYCRVNFTVRLAVHSLLSGRTSIVKVPHNDQLQRRTPFSDHQSYPTLYSNDNVVSLILAYIDISLA